MIEYKKAVVKFDGGNGALLCNRCHAIIATGSDHEDVEHFCDECKSAPEKPFQGRIVAWRLVGLPVAYVEGIFIDREDMGLRSRTSALVSEPNADGEIETLNSRYALCGDEYSDETRRAAGLLIDATRLVPADEGFAYVVAEMDRRRTVLLAVVAAIDVVFIKSGWPPAKHGLREALDAIVLGKSYDVTTLVLSKVYGYLWHRRVHMLVTMREEFDAIAAGLSILLAYTEPEIAQRAAAAVTRSAQWAVDRIIATKPRAQAMVAAWNMMANGAGAIGEIQIEGAIREELSVCARELADAIERNITGAVSVSPPPAAASGIVVMPRFGGGTSASAKEIEARYKKMIGARLPVVHAKDLGVVRSKLVAEFPHFGEQIDVLLSDLQEGEEIRLRPTLLLGEPGNGKSRLARRMSDALGVGLHRFDGANAMDGAFGGTARRWSTGEHCYPFEGVCRYRIANPIMLVDEVDKAATRRDNGSLNMSLLPFLESETAKRYPDPYAQSDLDLSHVSYMATANDDRDLAKPLRDRLRVLRMPMATVEHLPALARSLVAEIAGERGGDPRFLPDFDGDELEIARRLWAAGGSVRRLREIVSRILAYREKQARN